MPQSKDDSFHVQVLCVVLNSLETICCLLLKLPHFSDINQVFLVLIAEPVFLRAGFTVSLSSLFTVSFSICFTDHACGEDRCCSRQAGSLTRLLGLLELH